MSRPDVATVAELFSGLYEIIEPMPWNGLAPTYKAKKHGTNEKIVVALLPIDAGGSPETATVFQARARALVGLDHPRLLPVKAQAIRHGVPYLELPYAEGETLDRIVARVPLHRDRAVTIARRILRALELLEAVNVLHLDLTPSNILVAGDDEARVMGAGVAALLREVRDTDKTGPTGRGSGPSPGRYLAPELLVGDEVDARTDVYSVGALLHLMLTGHPLGKGGPAPPADLAPIIERATARSREDRYPSAAAMRVAIEGTGAPLSVVPPPLPASPGDRRDAGTSAPEVSLPSGSSAPLGASRRSRALVMAGIAGALTTAAIASAVLTGGGTISGEAVGAAPEPVAEPEPTPEPEPEPTAEPAPVVYEAPAPDSMQVAEQTDLLAGDLPAPLAALWLRVAAGEELPLRERHLVARFAAANPRDARPHILLARDFMARGWSSDAIDEYVQSYAADPECRRDTALGDDLLELAMRETSGPAAARAIARIYGREAIPEVQAALDRDPPPNHRRRLAQLQRRLGRL